MNHIHFQPETLECFHHFSIDVQLILVLNDHNIALHNLKISYLKNEYAQSPTDSHPNSTFSARAAAYLCNRIIDVIEGSGDTGSHTGR